MAHAPWHPAREQIQLPLVLDCLSDPIRLAIVHRLAKHALAEMEKMDLCCGDFSGLSGKSNLAYHFAKLRESGLLQTRIEGTTRYMSLRRDDLNARFPGLIDSVLQAVDRDADQLPSDNRPASAAG